jgi:predicted component of type VI protein secretion system
MPMLREDDPMQSILAPIDTADKEISRIWFVVDALPDNDELERQVRTLHNRSDDLRSQILPVEGDPRHVQLPAGIYEGVMELQKQVDGLGQTVWPLADSEYDKAKHRFRVFTLVSYFTYGLGWLLTFVRGLFGAAKPALGE